MEDEPQQVKPGANEVRTPTPGPANLTPTTAKLLAENRTYRLLGKVVGSDASGEGGFELTTSFSKGGASIIYKGIERSTKKPVIIKVLRDEVAVDEELIARFGEEAAAAEILTDHPHIMSPLAHGEKDGDLYIVYEFIPGAIDHSRITTTPKEDAEVLRQTLDALIYAHSKGILHRDVKPSNTLVKREKDGVKSWLLDFGLGKIKFKGGSSIQTVQGTLMGTPHYISPEQAKDLSSANEKSDLFSLACMAFNIHTETLPCEDIGDLTSRDNPEIVRGRIIANRINDACTFDMWINEGVARKRYQLKEGLKKEDGLPQEEKNEARIKTMRAQLDNTQEVSDDYQDLWERVRLAKDHTMRPKPKQIFSRLEKLIAEDKVVPRPLTAEEIKKNDEDHKRLLSEVETLKEGRDKIAAEGQSEVIKKRYNILYSLGQALERLTELAPLTDHARLEFIRDAVNYYREAHTLMRLKRYLFMDSSKTDEEQYTEYKEQLGDLEDIMLWARSTQQLEYKRKQYLAANIDQTRARGLIATVESLIKEGKHEEAATEYRQITTSKLPDESRQTFDQVTTELRNVALGEIEKGTAELGKSSEAAKAHYERACKFRDALRNNAGDVGEKVTNLSKELRKHEVSYLCEDYRQAEEGGSFYEMAGILDELETHSDLDEDTRKMVREGKRSLRSKINGISLLRQFVRTSEDLEKEISEYDSLNEQQIKDYTGDINDSIEQLNAVKKEDIGPFYDQFQSTLQSMMSDVLSHEWLANVSSKDYETKVRSRFNLMMHYRSRDDKEREVEYGRMLAATLTDNLVERETMIRRKDSSKEPEKKD